MSTTKKGLTLDEKNRLAQFLLANSTNGSVHNGKIKEAAGLFDVSRRTVHYIWAVAKSQITQGIPVMICNNRKGVPRAKHVQLDTDRMKNIAFQKRSTIRRLARELDVSKSIVGRWVKDGTIKPHTNAIKPELTDFNKFQRLKYSLNALVLEDNQIQFSGMHNIVHIDEKWFYMSKASERYYMVPGEDEPYRSCKSKRFIPKIMFMGAVSRPQYENGEMVFDGKIGLFPFTIKEPAKRNSKNRVRGTLVTKPMESITKDVIKNCLVNQIIPAIKAKWPANASKHIIIQQDNAKPHIHNDDPEFRAAASSDGFNILLVCQPPNSPDTNILDLGWFRAIQSLQVDTASYNVDDLVKNVLLSFENLTAITLNKVFLSLQSCLIEIMKAKGHNNYKLPHMSKDRLLREERLPMSLQVSEELVRECIQYLIEAGQVEGLAYDISHLMLGLGF